MLIATFDETYLKVYINGTLTVTTQRSFTLPTLSRNLNYIGKSNWAGDGYSYSYLDDLRFYNKSLTQTDLTEIMNQNQTS